LHSPQQTTFEQILIALINDLVEIDCHFVVVLDDYHLLNSQSIQDSIPYLLEHIPVQMHLVIASRAGPPLPLSRYRGKGTMLEIGTDNLRFTPEDATSLLKEMKIAGISVEDIVALNERTRGWVAGLVMAALSMRGLKDIPGYIAAFTGSQRYVMDYLVEEVLQKQSEEMRGFLLKTSILERLSGSLCNAVTGRNDSRDILLNLERGHLFIVPLDESRQSYRYDLFSLTY
jgi:LuxR family maltose regulon positive regulatory protein